MAKKRLKNDHLAKLRQFKKGMNVEDYLENQHRQVIRALEESYVVGDDLTPYATNEALNNVASTLPIVSGVHAIFDGQQFVTGNVNFSFWHCPASAGTFDGTVFRPAKAGVYWIEIMFRLTAFSSVGAYIQIDVDIIKEGPSVLESYLFTMYPRNETDDVGESDAIRAYLGSGPVPAVYKHAQTFTTLTPTQGAYIKFTTNIATSSLYKMVCKIYRIGD